MDTLRALIWQGWCAMSRGGRNLIAFLLPILLMVACSSALADTYSASKYWRYCAGGNCFTTYPDNYFSTPTQACKGANSTYKLGPVYASDSAGPYLYDCLNQYDGNTGMQASRFYECKYGGTLSGSSCVNAPSCPAPQVRNATTGQCEAPCQPAGIGAPVGTCGCQSGLTVVGGVCTKDCTAMQGKIAGTSRSSAMLSVSNPKSYNGNQSFCYEGCAAAAQGGVQCHWNNDAATGDMLSIGAYCAGQGPFQFNGRNCASYGAGGIAEVENFDSDPQTPWWESGKDAKDCTASGGAWGEVNGVSTCVGAGVGGGGTGGSGSGSGTGSGSGDGSIQKGGSDSKPSEKATTTNPDGSTTSTETSTSSKCENGVCTITTTQTVGGTNADGSAKTPETTTKTETKPQQAFCEANPKAAGCTGTEGSGSQWGGGCGNFSCTGDAVQCATARAVWSSECRWQEMTDGSSLYDQMSAGNDPAFSGPNGNPLTRVAVNVGGISYTSQAESCPADVHLSVMGRTVAVPFSQQCDLYRLMGRILVGLAWLGAFFIVAPAIKGG